MESAQGDRDSSQKCRKNCSVMAKPKGMILGPDRNQDVPLPKGAQLNLHRLQSVRQSIHEPLLPVAGWSPVNVRPVCTFHVAMHALSRTGLWPTEKSDGRRHQPPRSSGKSPLPAMSPPQLRRSKIASEATKGRFYFQLAAGLTSELEVTLGLRTPEEAALGCDLFRAAEASNAKLVRNLLAEGADALQRHAAGQVPLHVARSPEVVCELIAACPAAAGVRSFTGQTPVQRYMTLNHKLAEELLLAVASPAALEGLLEHRAGRSLLGLMHPSLARAVLQRASGRVSFVPSGFEAVAVLSQDPVSLGELRRLWRRLPKNFEARVLQHLVLEAAPTPATAQQLQRALETVLRHLCGKEEAGGLKRHELAELAEGLMQVLGGLSCPKWSLAALAVDLCFEMNKEEPTAFSLLLGSLPTACSNMIMHTDDSSLQQDALSWLLLGFATMPSCRALPLSELSRLLDPGLTWHSEEDLCSHAVALQASLEGCRSVAEEMVLAVQSVRQEMKGVEPLQAAIAWAHCAQLWQRSMLAEEEVQNRLQELLRSFREDIAMSDMQFRCRKVQSYSQAWQKAMAAWPRAIQCRLPGLLVWDLLVMDIAVPTAMSLRTVHDLLPDPMCRLPAVTPRKTKKQGFTPRLHTDSRGGVAFMCTRRLRLEWAWDLAEVLWSANNFDLSAGGDLEGFTTEGCLREIMRLHTSHGSILVDVRLVLLVQPVHARPLKVLRSVLSGQFETSQKRRSLWASLIHFLLSEASVQTIEAMESNEELLLYAGKPMVQRLQELSAAQKKLREEAREGEDLAAALRDRAALADKRLKHVDALSYQAFETCLSPRTLRMQTKTAPAAEDLYNEEPWHPAISCLQQYLYKASPAAPAFALDVAALASQRLKALQS
eukprot:s2716_g7.t1